MDTSKCTEVIEKIGENHVIVKKVLYDREGKEVIIEIEEYGNERIGREMESAITETQKWETMKTDTQKIDEQISISQNKLAKINLINTEMKAIYIKI